MLLILACDPNKALQPSKHDRLKAVHVLESYGVGAPLWIVDWQDCWLHNRPLIPYILCITTSPDMQDNTIIFLHIDGCLKQISQKLNVKEQSVFETQGTVFVQCLQLTCTGILKYKQMYIN